MTIRKFVQGDYIHRPSVLNAALTDADNDIAAAQAAATTAAQTYSDSRLVTGTGSPEGVITANVGKLYEQTDATGGTAVWVKVLGTGNTGWLQLGLTNGDVDARGYGAKFTGEDPTSYVTSALTAASTSRRVRGAVRNDPEKPGAFQSLLAALDDAEESVALQVLGDSTGDETDEWVYLVTQYLAGLYPAYSVDYRVWNDGTQAYGTPVAIQTGPNGARYQQWAGVSLPSTIPGSEITAFTGDVDVRVKATSATGWSAGAVQILACRYGAAGNRAFKFGVDATGHPVYVWSTDGTTLNTATCSATTASAGISSATPTWFRVTHTMNNGSSGNGVQFWYSTDDGTYTQLGSTITTAGALTTLYGPASSVNWEIGVSSNTSEKLTGKIYQVRILQGLNGPDLAPEQVDAWLSGSAITGGSPTLYVVNGSKPGADLSYLSDSTRLPKMTPKFGQAAVILSCSHNDSSFGPTYLSSWDSWLTAIRARLPLAATVVLSQNPRLSSVVSNHAHAIRRRQLIAWAMKNGCGHVDTYRAFMLDGRALSTLINADGVHPAVGTGRLVWAQAVMQALTKRAG